MNQITERLSAPHGSGLGRQTSPENAGPEGRRSP